MFGAFDLQLPASLQARLSGVGGAGYAGSFAMGLVAGLIAAHAREHAGHIRQWRQREGI